MMNLKHKKVLVIGGAGFIGGFVVSELLKENVEEVVIYDNFARGKMENIEHSLLDKRCSLFPLGGDIRETDVLNEAMKGRSEEHTSELQSRFDLVCRLLLEKKNHI